MRLLLIASYPRAWTVLSIEDESGDSAWTWLASTGDNKRTRALAQKMRARIREHMPRYGPPTNSYHGTILAGTGGVGELRVGPKRGPKLRVLYFFGRGQKEIVLSHAFWKSTEVAPDEIARAQTAKSAYVLATDFQVRRLKPQTGGG